MTMTRKQRVLAAIAGQTPDRIPLDFSANPATLARLKRDLNVSSHRELLDRLHVDIVDLRGVVDPTYRGPGPLETTRPDGVKINLWGMRSRVMRTATGSEECWVEHPLRDARSLEQFESHAWPRPDWFDFSDFGGRLEPWDDLAVMASGPSVFQHPTFLRGMESLLSDMLVEPELYDYLADRFTDYYVDYFHQLFLAVPGRIDILRIADDLAMQDRLLFSPGAFDRFIAPRLTRLIEMAHDHGVKVMFHSCGAVRPLIERLIELGVDILDPIQVRARGMEPGQLKHDFGDRIALHGSLDTQYVLPRGSVDDVRRAVGQMIESLGPAGFILAPSHVLQTDVTTDNILALYETGYQAGRVN